MCSNPVVPDYNSVWRPLNTSLEVLALGDVVIEEVEEEVAFLLLVANDATSELRVYEQRLLASCRVCANDGVNRGHWVTADDTAAVSGVVCLLDACIIVSACPEY